VIDSLDLNRRSDFILNKTDAVGSVDFRRVINIALPFINFHPGAGRVTGVALGVHRMVDVLKKDTPLLNRTYELAPIVGSIALSTLFPVIHYTLSQGLSLASHQWKLGCHLWRLEGKEAAKEFFLSASQIVHILSSVYALPELLFLSLLMQAATEAAEAISEYRASGWTPEVLAKISLCLIRSAQAVPHGKTLHRNYFGKTLTTELWEKMYVKILNSKTDSGEIDIEALLKKEWISSHIRDVSFKSNDLRRVIFQNMRLNRCDFSNAHFKNSKLLNISMNSCVLDQSIWINSICQNIRFNQCSLIDFGLIHSNASNISFKESDLSYACFNSSNLNRISISQSHLKETSFLYAKVKKGQINKSTIEDVFFAGAEPAFSINQCKSTSSRKPIIALAWNFVNSGEMTPNIYAAIKANGALALRFEQFPDEIDPELLKQEVTKGLEEIENNFSMNSFSRPRELLKHATPLSQMALIKKRAEELTRYVDGFALPGGNDIEPAFYGQERDFYTYCEKDLRRSMTEFAILDQAYDQKIPTMGTCRGSQMINVFLGGDLEQHVDGHWGIRKMQWTNSPYADRFRQSIGDEMIGLSAHHQASRQMGKDLEVILEYDGVPKLFTSRDGIFLGSQIHPEVHIGLAKNLEEILAEATVKEETKDEDAFFQENELSFFEKCIADNQSIYRHFISVFTA